MSEKGKFIKGGIIGAIVGALAGVLFAPKAGKETRKDIKEAAVKVTSEAEKKLKELHKEIQQAIDEAKKQVSKLSGKGKEDLEELVHRADLVKDKIGEMISIIREGDGEEVNLDKIHKEANSIREKIAKKIAPKK